jgi:small subunit ribosomal protein S7e
MTTITMTTNTVTMASKIVKPAGAQPDELELSVAQAILDLETSDAKLKQELRPLQITAAKEVCMKEPVLS